MKYKEFFEELKYESSIELTFRTMFRVKHERKTIVSLYQK